VGTFVEFDKQDSAEGHYQVEEGPEEGEHGIGVEGIPFHEIPGAEAEKHIGQEPGDPIFLHKFEALPYSFQAAAGIFNIEGFRGGIKGDEAEDLDPEGDGRPLGVFGEEELEQQRTHPEGEEEADDGPEIASEADFPLSQGGFAALNNLAHKIEIRTQQCVHSEHKQDAAQPLVRAEEEAQGVIGEQQGCGQEESPSIFKGACECCQQGLFIEVEIGNQEAHVVFLAQGGHFVPISFYGFIFHFIPTAQLGGVDVFFVGGVGPGGGVVGVPPGWGDRAAGHVRGGIGCWQGCHGVGGQPCGGCLFAWAYVICLWGFFFSEGASGHLDAFFCEAPVVRGLAFTGGFCAGICLWARRTIRQSRRL